MWGMFRLFLICFIFAFASLAFAHDPESIDSKINPCEDFYQYACGSWLEKTQIPRDKTRWSSFSTLNEKTLSFLKSKLEMVSSSSDKEQKKLSNYYNSCLTRFEHPENTTNAVFSFLETQIQKIRLVSDKRESLFDLIANMHHVKNPIFFGLYVDQDPKNATQMILHLGSGGWSLPDRDYYFRVDKKSLELKQQFEDHMVKVWSLLGSQNHSARDNAKAVLRIEMSLAKNALTLSEQRDPQRVYNLTKISDLVKINSRFPLAHFFKKFGISENESINLREPAFFNGMLDMIKKAKLSDLKAYLEWHLIKELVPLIPEKGLMAENFNFFNQTLLGQKSIAPTWKRCVESSQGAFGELLGKMYVQENFAGKSKQIALEMIAAIMAAFNERLNSIDWMDSETRIKAKEKLGTIVSKIGFPDKWMSYDSLAVNEENYLENKMNASKFHFERELSWVNKPVDRSIWWMNPQMVNAYYNPAMNEIVFPAGILQSPFFNAEATPANNFGGIGMVIGHEITHGFDDEGSQFDATGNLNDWWTSKVKSTYAAKTSCIESQYSKYKVQDNLFVNGKLTLGENIADNGGIRLAYMAWKKVKTKYTRTSVWTGTSDDQEFFLSYAQGWCTKRTPQDEQKMVFTNPHSPERFRVNGPLSNMSEFSKAFNCEVGRPMAPLSRCEVW